MRFEVAAAFFLGALLPLLETGRRGIGYWKIEFLTMFEDYFAGALLLFAAWATHSNRRWGPLLLVVSWAWFSNMMSASFVSQIEETLRRSVTEPYNPIVIMVKFLLWAVGLVSLVLASRKVLAALPQR